MTYVVYSKNLNLVSLLKWHLPIWLLNIVSSLCLYYLNIVNEVRYCVTTLWKIILNSQQHVIIFLGLIILIFVDYFVKWYEESIFSQSYEKIGELYLLFWTWFCLELNSFLSFKVALAIEEISDKWKWLWDYMIKET